MTARRDAAPTGLYRLQLHAGFGFSAAAELVPYLAGLGVSHLYVSPVLQAAPGSMHGYDVVDHSRVSADLGGRDGLVELAATAHRHRLGIVLDIVPNHMALPAPEHLNAELWDVLKHGRSSPFARWFDIDWRARDGRICLPVVDGRPAEALSRGELWRGEHHGEPVWRYHDHVLPFADGTQDLGPGEALDRQHWLLADYWDKPRMLNYRRFFDVDTLIGVRVEDLQVFESTHAVLLDLHAAGVVDGFRVDHPDGLADPEGYLARLRDATAGAWVAAEKILEGEEALPLSWSCAGTTGYDALRAVQDALVDPAGRGDLDALWATVGGAPDEHQVRLDAKADVLSTALAPELTRLATVAAHILDHAEPSEQRVAELSDALGRILVRMEVYRAYVRPGDPAPESSRARLVSACSRASADRPELAGLIARLLGPATEPAAAPDLSAEFAVRLQQLCGPVMAKGVEDTAFYRWHRLVALAEVGGDPATLDREGPDRLHRWAARQQADWPAGMTTLSTHDTKRSEDVRGRLLAGSGDMPAWARAVAPVLEASAEDGVDAPTAYLLWQTLAGAWPIEPERLASYLTKAVREAGQHTSWAEPDEEYERRVVATGRRCLAAGPVRAALERWLAATERAARATSLAAKLLQLSLPGVPDVYQGCELVDRSLVDPDNRRPVDFADRAVRLARLDAGRAARDLDDEKLLVTATALRLRRRRPDVFGPGSTYASLGAGEHVLGFVRSGAVATVVTRAPARLEAAGGWTNQAVGLPGGRWTDLLTGTTHTGAHVSCSAVFATLPVALLERA